MAIVKKQTKIVLRASQQRRSGEIEMKEKRPKHKDKGIRSVKYSPVPDFITCPGCGFEIELWSGEDETRCFFCGHRFFKKEATVH